MKKIVLSFLLLAFVKAGFAQTPNVFFSEYFRAGINITALEVINASGSAVDISKLRITTYYNGSTSSSTSSTTSLADDGSTTQIPNGEVFVFYNPTGFTGNLATDLPNASASRRAGLSTGGSMGYSGDDAVSLEYSADGTNWIMIDLMGVIGEDPGSAWTDNTDGVYLSTSSRSLYRLPSVTTGVKTSPAAGSFDVSSEWGLNYNGAPSSPYTSLGVTGQTTTLPIELNSFNAKATNTGNYLSWSTASEQNNNYFEILSSTDGDVFKVIGKVSGAINSSSLKNYSYTDKNPAKGITYYLLKQVDLNGNSKTYGSVYVNNKLTASLDFYVSANSEKLNIRLSSSKKEQLDINLFNLNGQSLANKKVFLSEGNNEIILPVQLQSGVYVLYLSGSTIHATKKILIN